MGFEVKHGGFRISINRKNGVYRLGTKSGDGKSYLCKKLEEFRLLGDPVIGVTYKDVLDGSDKIRRILDHGYRVVMFDRYDMYSNKFRDEIEKLRDHAIVLIDYKTYTGREGIYCGLADVTLFEDEIEVS